MTMENKLYENGKVPVSLRFLSRIGVLLFTSLIILKTEAPLQRHLEVILLGFLLYQMLAACIHWPAMRIPAARLLFSMADLLVAWAVVWMTGGMASPLIPCIFIPVLYLHITEGWKGLAGSILVLLSCAAVYFLVPKSSIILQIDKIAGQNSHWIVIVIYILLFYVAPYIGLKEYFRMGTQVQKLKEKYNETDSMNSKLLVLYEMTGRFNYESGPAQVMDRLLALCGELFDAERICIFLIRGGEVEIYGNASPQEKESIYQLIVEQKKAGAKDEDREYIIWQDSLVIPLVRGPRTDGVLYFHGWKNKEITYREAILLSMIANMFCTYLENLEYVDSLRKRLIPDTSVLLKQLDSGRQVKGILDKRIVAKE